MADKNAGKAVPLDLIALILLTAKDHPYGPPAAFMALTNARPAEAYAFDPSIHCNWETMKAHIVDSYKLINNNDYVLTSGTKNTSGRARYLKERYVDIPEVLAPLLRGHRGPLLTQEDGSQVTKSSQRKQQLSYERYLISRGANAGLHWTPRDMRTTWASMSVHAGFTPKELQDKMGHISAILGMDTYARVLSEMQGETGRKMNKFIADKIPLLKSASI